MQLHFIECGSPVSSVQLESCEVRQPPVPSAQFHSYGIKQPSPPVTLPNSYGVRYPSLVVENTMRVMVVADLHIGIESGLARYGVHITSNASLRLNPLVSTIERERPDLLVLLGDVKHNVSATSRQEFREIPEMLRRLRELVPIRVAPGNHDGGLKRFLRDEEVLPMDGALIDGTGYLHGHACPSPELRGHLIVAGHVHPVVSVRDEVGCVMRAQPAYLYAGLDGECLRTGWMSGTDDSPTRVVFMPAFNELTGGIDVTEIRGSGLGPLSRCFREDCAEVFLADGTFIGPLASVRHEE